MSQDVFTNKGLILKPGHLPPADPSSGRTFIISGVGRGGTTLLAEVLREAGMHLGEDIADLVGEDQRMLRILRSGDPGRLDETIAQRNAKYHTWGFKIPNIHSYLLYKDLTRFRNPHLILVFRDPLAIAVRNALAEHFDPLDALRTTTHALTGLAEFAHHSTCPNLLISYEKALIFPGIFIDALTAFCKLSVDESGRQRLLDHVRPNAEAYVKGARRRFAGAIDSMRDGILHGWGCEVGELAPVDLDLFFDKKRILTFKADRFRSDVLEAGYGNGNHGFSIDVTGLASDQRAVLRVRISGRTFELQNSGRTLSDYQYGAEDQLTDPS